MLSSTHREKEAPKKCAHAFSMYAKKILGASFRVRFFRSKGRGVLGRRVEWEYRNVVGLRSEKTAGI